MAEVTVTPWKNGPYMVLGPVKLVDHEGKECSVECGESSNKPFCDGTHGKNGFTG